MIKFSEIIDIDKKNQFPAVFDVSNERYDKIKKAVSKSIAFCLKRANKDTSSTQYSVSDILLEYDNHEELETIGEIIVVSTMISSVVHSMSNPDKIDKILKQLLGANKENPMNGRINDLTDYL